MFSLSAFGWKCRDRDRDKRERERARERESESERARARKRRSCCIGEGARGKGERSGDERRAVIGP